MKLAPIDCLWCKATINSSITDQKVKHTLSKCLYFLLIMDVFSLLKQDYCGWLKVTGPIHST